MIHQMYLGAQNLRHPIPFRYPGGKHYAIDILRPFWEVVPHSEYREVFMGGGSVFFNKPKSDISNINGIITDIKMPGMDGLEVLDVIREKHPETAVVMISGHGDIDTAVDSMKKGAYDYIAKPPDLNRLISTVRNALDRNQLVKENKTLKKKISKNLQL